MEKIFQARDVGGDSLEAVVVEKERREMIETPESR